MMWSGVYLNISMMSIADLFDVFNDAVKIIVIFKVDEFKIRGSIVLYITADYKLPLQAGRLQATVRIH